MIKEGISGSYHQLFYVGVPVYVGDRQKHLSHVKITL